MIYSVNAWLILMAGLGISLIVGIVAGVASLFRKK